jgi:hypothetical protein
VEGEGPRLDALNDPAALGTLRAEIDHEAIAPIYDTIARVRQDLPGDAVPGAAQPQPNVRKTPDTSCRGGI